ncbi:MAG TPA: DUF6528 family protein [Bryobacteraceae bacterium]|nr:DUF6528 family protein [Bryobacteraceae bacterium]HOL73368.1 DUF6528 family protein [Bryobacteraceae bacterium]HOQ46711.1 DUF6528 family protein [Bryobacteraceae bacterium]HPQ14056.1 DUF6528 family protein [Bryobacteraceae bacterium]HPU72381.1 DUF6528 family protein [Bryobacteraceae bacterium]
MKIFRWLLACCVIVAGVLLLAGPPAAPSRELIVCGWDEVFILDMAAQPPVKVWSWKAADRPELPESMRDKFKTTDECKPVDGGRILITASSDGVALVERASGKVLFYGIASGAHSAEMLPGGRIAVASSTGRGPLNNSLVLFDSRKSGEPLFHTELRSGHGVVWDEKRQVLWVLGGSQLRTYTLAKWDTEKPELVMTAEYTLPDRGGHDLSPVPGTDLLSVTTERHSWLFDRTKRVFLPHPRLADDVNVKCITIHPVTKQTVWTKADEGFWWTATLRFLDPDGTLELKGERLYKARWVMPPR